MELLSPHLTPHTRAVYVTSPNNPDGVVLDDTELESIARFCVDNDLYVLSDEAYERFFYGQRPRALASFPGMSQRTIRIYTFSKSHRMAGLRVGWTVAPPDVKAAMVKLANISVYNVSLIVQGAALAGLRQCEDSVTETVDAARSSSAIFCEILDELGTLTYARPQGGAYVFADLSGVLGDGDCFELLDACLDEGIVFAPGAGFGWAYEQWARFCYTAMEPERLRRGAERLADVLVRFTD
jgi:aspartate/methionine/tyrosine aminotransferase